MMAISGKRTAQSLDLKHLSEPANEETIDLRPEQALYFERLYENLQQLALDEAVLDAKLARRERSYQTRTVFASENVPNVSEFFETVELCGENKAVAALAEYGFDMQTAAAIASVINVNRPLHLVQQLPRDLEDLALGRSLENVLGLGVDDSKSDLGEFSGYFGNLMKLYASSLSKRLGNELDLVVKAEERIKGEENVGIGYLPDAEDGEKLGFKELQESAILLLYSKYLQKTATREKTLSALKLIGRLQAKLAGRENEFLNLENKITLEHYENKVFQENEKDGTIAQFLEGLENVPAIYLMQWDPHYVMKPPRSRIEVPENITLYAIIPPYFENERTKLGEARRRGEYKNTKPVVAGVDVPSELTDLMSAYWFYNFKQLISDETDEEKKAFKPYKTEVHNIIYRHRNSPRHSCFDFYGKSDEKLGRYHVRLSKYGHYGIPIIGEDGKKTTLRFDVYNSDGYKKTSERLSLKMPVIWKIVKNFKG
jgi:hypothetical protein